MWNTIHGEDRLLQWKKFRKEISGLSLDEQLSQVAKFCAGIPFGSRTLDYYSPENWPTRWKILYHGSFCTSSISLLIFQTLALIPVEADMKMLLVEDDDGPYLLPMIDNQYILNYELGVVNTIQEIGSKLEILTTFSHNQIK